MGDAQRLTPDEQLRLAREQFEEADDFTVAVEEEFAILDPETLGLANRFEELQAAAVGTCLLYTSPSPRDRQKSRMPSSA